MKCPYEDLGKFDTISSVVFRNFRFKISSQGEFKEQHLHQT